MLSKLLKYEMKATARIFLPLMAVVLIFAGINKLISALSPDQWQAPQIISMILYVTILIGMIAMTLVVMIQRFYKNLLTDEGYLMFTLPAKAWKHITSKLAVATLWTVVSGITALISIMIIAWDKIFTEDLLQTFTQLMEEYFRFFGASGGLLIFEVILAIITGLISNVLIVYASIALGQLVNRHRILASLASFIVLNTVSQIILVIAGLLSGNLDFNAEINSLTEFAAMQQFIHFIMWFCIIFAGLLSAGYFVLTNYILSKRLNLE